MDSRQHGYPATISIHLACRKAAGSTLRILEAEKPAGAARSVIIVFPDIAPSETP
jgi:hypothetical protein